MSFKKDSTKLRQTREEVLLTKKETNLYLCKADIFLPRTQILATRKHLEKILSHVDPGWKFIRIRDNESSPLNRTDKQLNLDKQTNNEKTGVQALSVIIFLNEAQYHEVLETVRSETEIWQLRHTTKLLNNIDSSTVIGCMDYYEYSPDLPLWAISPVHFGSKVLRFNIFVKDFETMREYYERLTLQQYHFVRKGFGIFKIHSYPGLEVQISLKKEMNTELYLTKSAVLRLKFRKIDVVRCNIVSTLEQIYPKVWRTEDPEGNTILLEEIGNEPRDKLTKRRSKCSKEKLVFV